MLSLAERGRSTLDQLGCIFSPTGLAGVAQILSVSLQYAIIGEMARVLGFKGKPLAPAVFDRAASQLILEGGQPFTRIYRKLKHQGNLVWQLTAEELLNLALAPLVAQVRTILLKKSWMLRWTVPFL